MTTENQDQPSGALDAAFLAKAGSSKSGMSPVGNIAISPTQTNELLLNMQQMINQRAGVPGDQLVFSGGPRYNTIMGSLKDVAAWASGGAKGPTEGLALRDAEKAKEAKDLFEMRTKMAEYKAAQDAAKATADRLAANLKGGAGTGGTPGTGMTYAGIPVPLSVQAQIQGLPAVQQDAILNKWLETTTTESVKSGYNPAANEQKPYAFGGDIGTVYLTSNQFAALDPKIRARIEKATLEQFGPDALTPTTTKTETSAAPAVKGTPVSLDLVSTNPTLRRIGAGESNLFNIPNAAGTSNAYGVYQIVPSTFELVKSKSPEFKDITWEQFKADPKIQTAVAEKLLAENDKLLDQNKIEKTDLNRYTTWFSGDTKLAAADAKTPIEQVMSEKQIAANKLAGKTVGQVRDMLEGNLKRGDQVLASIKTPTTTAQTGGGEMTKTSATTTGRRSLPSGMPDPRDYPVPGTYEAAVAAWKEGQIAGSKKMAESGEAQRTAFETDIEPNNIADTDATSKRMQKIIKESPQIAGVINKEGYQAAVAGVLQKGIGNFGIGDLENAIFKSLPETTQKEIGRRSELITYLAQVELKAAKLIKGQGQITEGEREILQRASASISDPAELIYKKARILERANQKNEALAKIYGSGEDFKDFRKFSQDPRFQEIMKNYRADLNNIMDEEVSFRRPKANAAPKVQHPDDIQKIINKNKPKVD